MIAKPRTSSSPWARTIGRTTHAGTALSVTKSDLIKNQAGVEPIAPNATNPYVNLESGMGVRGPRRGSPAGVLDPTVIHAQDARATATYFFS